MEDRLLIENSEFDEENKFRIHSSRVISHAVLNALTEIIPALDMVKDIPNVSYRDQQIAIHAQLVARELSSKVNGLAEMFGESDSLSSPQMASFILTQVFDAFTTYLNNVLSQRLECKISYEIDPKSEPDAIFDQRRVSSILYYLIANSLQHGKTDNKNVKLICKSTTDSFELIVRDYGGGIPKEIQPTLFTRFLTEHNIRYDKGSLLPPRIQGLGLPLSRKLARDMGGELSFKNYRGGAQFTLTIPQHSHGFQEVTEYAVDEKTMNQCMASLWLYLDEKMKEIEF